MVEGPLFRLDRLDGPPSSSIQRRYSCGPLLVIPLDCTVTIAGQGVGAGQCGLADNLDLARFPESGLCLIAQPL